MGVVSPAIHSSGDSEASFPSAFTVYLVLRPPTGAVAKIPTASFSSSEVSEDFTV